MVGYSLQRTAGLFTAVFLFAGSPGCRPEKAPDAGIKVAEQAVKWSPDIAAAAVRGARSARPVKVDAAQPPPVQPYPNTAGPCAYQGAAPDGRPVYLCNGYPWVQDLTTGAWVLYTPEQASAPRRAP
jgi:hypothetical protein